MDEAIKYISKIEIKGLWGRYDLEWNLYPDVNVLSGVNGSGKSTILRCVYEFIQRNYEPNFNLFARIKELKVTFNSGEVFTNTYQIKTKQEFNITSSLPPTNGLESTRYNEIGDMYEISTRVAIYPPLRFGVFPFTNFIKPIDNQLLQVEAVQKLSDERVKTDLDWQLYIAQQNYLRYQIRISKTVYQLAENNGSKMQEKLQEINRPKAKLIKILNDIFTHTDKKVNDETEDISFFVDKKSISAYDLSSGEKQILIILLTTLVQDQKPAILFMDEPEISVHFDLQKKLIDYIRELNPNVQIILATHSPAIIMDGWMDKVKEVSDLIVHDNQEAVLENAE